MRGSEACGKPLPADSFQQVAGGAAHERIYDIVRAVGPAQNDDQRLRRGSRDPAYRPDTVAGQLELDQADVRPHPRRDGNRRGRIVGLPNDYEALPLERLSNGAAM